MVVDTEVGAAVATELRPLEVVVKFSLTTFVLPGMQIILHSGNYDG